MKSIKSEEFFKLVAVNSGMVDMETTKRIYYGIIKTISRELKNVQIVKLPDWGEFVLKVQRPRRIKDLNNGTDIQLPAKPMVKFSPDEKVKHYFYTLGS